MSLFLVSFLLALFLPLLFLLTRNKSSDDSKLPPGKLGWPFIGETFVYIDVNKFVRDRMQKFSSDIFKTSLYGYSIIVFCGSTANKLLFSNENKLVRGWNPVSTAKIFPPPPNPTNEKFIFRKLITAYIRPDALKKYIVPMDYVAKQLLRVNFEKKKEVAFVPLTSLYTMEVVCKLTLSIDDPILIAKFDNLFSQVGVGVLCLPIDLPGTAHYNAINASKLLRRDFAEIIKKRRIDLTSNKASQTQDILSNMLSTSVDENGEVVVMSDEELANKILAVILAGHGTSSTLLYIVINYLAEFPHVYNQVHAEHVEILKSKASGESLNWDDVQKMKYSWNVACEALRFAPPAPGGFRQAIADFTYAGYPIPKGSILHWNPYSTHMNPDYFPDPEKFDPSRFAGNGPAPYTFVPFGGGPRMCPGNEYARILVCVFMHNLVTKFKLEKVSPEKLIYDPRPTFKKGLRIRLQPHVC